MWHQPKKKNMSAYQVFCKEYRVTIVADHPGIGKSVSDPSPFDFPSVPLTQGSYFSPEAAASRSIKGTQVSVFSSVLQVTLDFYLSSPQP